MTYPDYPFTSHTLDIDGCHLHYIDEGGVDANGSLRRADPIVMVHGNPTWSFYFRRLILTLREHYHCVAPDHIGMGLSDKPGEDQYAYTLASRADDLERLLDALGMDDNLTLVLHDWGGMIGMAFAARHPDRVKRLVLMNTAAFGLPEDQHLPWQLRAARSAAGPLLIRGLNAFCRGAARTCVARPLTPDVRAAYLAPYDSWANRIAVHRFVQDIPLAPSDPSYDLVHETQSKLSAFAQTPTLICWGMQDFVFTPPFLKTWRQHLPHAQVHPFDDAGHYVLEDAHEKIIPLVQQFLADNP